MINKNKAFSLIELIVVITILAILRTILFLSFQSYTSSARDTTKKTDITNLNKLLGLSFIKTWVYPQPDNSTSIMYSWAIARNQWIFWDTVSKIVWWINKKPLDPLLLAPYTYSVSWNWKEYQIWYMLENSLAHNSKIWLINSYADMNWLVGYVDWNYNWYILKVSTWSIDYYLAVPSIISSDISKSDILNQTWSFVINWQKNLPWNTAKAYFWNFKTDTGVYFNPNNFILYQTWIFQMIDWNILIDNFKKAYSWSSFTDYNKVTLISNIKVTDIKSIIQKIDPNLDVIFSTWQISNPFNCLDNIIISWIDYQTSLIWWKCWSSIIKHNPDKCYDSNTQNCSSWGWLYNQAASISICQTLWDWWHLPTNNDFNLILDRNVLRWITKYSWFSWQRWSDTPTYANNTLSSFFWASDWRIQINYTWTAINRNTWWPMLSTHAFSVICVK